MKSFSKKIPTMGIIAVISNDGTIYYSFTKGTTNEVVIMIFLKMLIQRLDAEDSNWRSKTVLVMDNASYHKSRMLISWFREMRLPVLFSSPYSFTVLPIERLFAMLKNRDFNISEACPRG